MHPAKSYVWNEKFNFKYVASFLLCCVVLLGYKRTTLHHHHFLPITLYYTHFPINVSIYEL